MRSISAGASLLGLALALGHGTAKGQTPLAIPDTLSGTVIDLSLDTGAVQLRPGPLTRSMGANGPLLGPTLLLDHGQDVTINVTNNLGEPSTVHWHGMHVAPENDGGPHTPIVAGDTWSPSFTVLDPASTYWYHPHLHMHTNTHTVKGIAGLIIVRDAAEAALDLPRTYGVDDIPVVIQSKELDANNQFVVGGPLDSLVLVNGTPHPYVDLPAQVVRLRMLNGSSERIYNLGFTGNLTFHQIGSDGGLLVAPVALTRVRLAPGERAEILVDLGGLQGSSLALRSFGSELPSAIYGAAQPGMGPGQVIPGYTSNPLNGADFTVLQMNVGAPTATAVTTIPTGLIPFTPLLEADADSLRSFTFMPVNMGPTAIQGPFLINMMPFDMMMINFDVPLDNIEVWTLTNQSPIAHPFHVHDVQFHILDINGAAPPANMQGLKDVVLVPAGMGTVRFIAQFKDHWSYDTPYMYHCHMLTHEDEGMMGQFRVIPAASGSNDRSPQASTLSAIPNPTTGRLLLQPPAAMGRGAVELRDATGRLIRTEAFQASAPWLDLSPLEAGTYIVTFRGERGNAATRVVKQ